LPDWSTIAPNELVFTFMLIGTYLESNWATVVFCCILIRRGRSLSNSSSSSIFSKRYFEPISIEAFTPWWDEKEWLSLEKLLVIEKVFFWVEIPVIVLIMPIGLAALMFSKFLLVALVILFAFSFKLIFNSAKFSEVSSILF
jgi:hypothetical protein